nr:probable glucosamine 6-phosphate N-acetyltransferase [Onthophagus taurus]
MVIINKMSSTGEYLYDPKLLSNLDWNLVRPYLSPFVTCTEPGESWLIVRPLQLEDYKKGFVQLLSQLTAVGNITEKEFESQYKAMQKTGQYYITVIEDTRSKTIIGAASLVTELKFIHGCGLRAKLEDVVVNNTYRGKQLGKLIVLTVTLLAKHVGCYKMTLDCKDNLIPFYKSIGYKLEPGNANSMTVRYEDPS